MSRRWSSWEESPELFEDVLRPLVREPTAWFSCGLDIAHTLPVLLAQIKKAESDLAAGQIEHGRDLLGFARVFTLVAGYAAEDFVKGLWVAHALKSGRGLDEGLEEAPLLPRALGHHGLPRLSEEAELPLSPKECKVLEKLERAIVWWAKYPVPRKAGDYRPFGTGSGEAEEIREVLRHLERLARAYSARPSTPWPPDASAAEAGW